MCECYSTSFEDCTIYIVPSVSLTRDTRDGIVAIPCLWNCIADLRGAAASTSTSSGSRVSTLVLEVQGLHIPRSQQSYIWSYRLFVWHSCPGVTVDMTLQSSSEAPTQFCVEAPKYTLSCTRHSFGNFALQCKMSRMSRKERSSPKTWLFSCPGPASAEDAPPAELSGHSEWLLTEWPADSDSPSIHLPNCAARVNLRRLQVRIVGVYK